MTYRPGEPAHWFVAPTPSNPAFAFDSAAGRYVLVLLPPAESEARVAALKALAAHQGLFDDVKACAFVLVNDPASMQGLRDVRGLRWFLDPKAEISRAYGPEPHWLLLDPALRVIATEPAARAEAMFARIAALPAPGDHAGVPLHAPVLIVPRVFEPELCAELIARHEADGGRFTGVMRDAGDRTVAVMDELKSRRDILLDDADLVAGIRQRLERRLFPMIKRGLGFTATRIDRFLVSCYAADDAGVFHPHRDNTTQGTAYRRFACSVNLNDDFEGGDLRFAEYGPATYRAPPGGAVVFSCALMHEAMRVRSGRRYAFLPFLYDESGAEILAAYQARVAGAKGATA